MIGRMVVSDRDLVEALLAVRARHPGWSLDVIGDAAALVLGRDRVEDLVAAVELVAGELA